MIVNNPQQAEEMVNKVIEYHDIKSYGSWRNNFVIISDDSDQTSDANLQSRQNQLADKITTHKPFFNINKIILDSYKHPPEVFDIPKQEQICLMHSKRCFGIQLFREARTDYQQNEFGKNQMAKI
jgi:hypothetical protein